MRVAPLLGLLLTACPESIPVLIYPDATTEQTRDSGFGDASELPDATLADTGIVADAGATDIESLDAGNGCAADPFNPCEDLNEPMNGNDDWSSGFRFHGTSVGCLSGDTFTGLDTRLDHVICPGEAADYFGLTVVPCDTRTMFMEFRFTPTAECSADVAFEFLSGGGVVACDSGRYNIQCSQEGGVQVVRLELEPGNSILSFYFGIRRVADRVRVPYSVALRLL